MSNTTKLTIWLVIGVLHLPTIVLPWLYWRRRQYDPLRSRRPALFLQCLISCVAFVWHQILGNAFGEYIGDWWNIIVSSVILLVAYESFFVFALSLYISYNKTKEQVAMYRALSTSSISTPAEVDALMRSIQWSSFLLSDRFAFGWVWANTASWMVVLIAYAQPFSYWAVSCEDILSGRITPPYSHLHFYWLLTGRNFVTVACLIWTSIRLRIVQDAFGTKAMLKRIGTFMIFATIFYSVTSNMLLEMSPLGIPSMVNIAICDYIMVVAFVLPLMTTRRTAKMLTVAEGSLVLKQERAAQSDFEMFLRTGDGFAAFKEHLEKEFAVENLLFWREVMEFKGEPTSVRAWAIFDKFLSKTAPLEVNLPYSTMRRFRERVFKDRKALVAEPSMFDDAAEQLLRLMETNSLSRFQKRNPAAWAKFMDTRDERRLLSQAGQLRKAPVTLAMRTTEFEIETRPM